MINNNDPTMNDCLIFELLIGTYNLIRSFQIDKNLSGTVDFAYSLRINEHSTRL